LLTSAERGKIIFLHLFAEAPMPRVQQEQLLRDLVAGGKGAHKCPFAM